MPANAAIGPTRDRFFYGWLVLIVASIQGFLGVGMVISGFLVFFLPIQSDIDINAASMSLVIGLAWAVSGVVAVPAGWVADKFGTRKLVLYGGVVTGVGLIMLSYSQSYWHLLLFYSGVVSIGRVGALSPTLLTVVNQWFVRRKPLAMAVLSTSFVAGAASVVPILAIGNTQIGWRLTILCCGVIFGITSIIVAAVLRNKPEDMGLFPDGDPVLPESNEVTSEFTEKEPEYTVRQALMTHAFWLLLIGLVVRVSVADGVIIHQIPILVWRGIEEQTAAYYLSFMFLIAIPLRFGLGIIGGYVSIRLILFIGMAVGSLATALMYMIGGTEIAIIFVLGLAIVEGIATTNWLAVGQYFGRRHFGTLVGIMTISHCFGSLIFPYISGWIFDETKSYDLVLLITAPLFMFGALAFLMAKKPVWHKEEK
tara:strand:- start:1980 stop:3251 length:1272 start_codon:yes stop_codon:yes gene_type:complete